VSTVSTASAPRRVLLRSRRVGSFAGAYLLRFLQANYQVAREIVTPGDGLAPAIVEVRLSSRTRFEIASYMSLISLTPGTVALALSEDRSRLVVHGMHAADPDAFRADLRGLEDKMLAAWRPVGRGPAVDGDHPTRRRTT
jgi:multicomponent Na+:H+ antiporter subunit E